MKVRRVDFRNNEIAQSNQNTSDNLEIRNGGNSPTSIRCDTVENQRVNESIQIEPVEPDESALLLVDQEQEQVVQVSDQRIDDVCQVEKQVEQEKEQFNVFVLDEEDLADQSTGNLNDNFEQFDDRIEDIEDCLSNTSESDDTSLDGDVTDGNEEVIEDIDDYFSDDSSMVRNFLEYST